jgi:phenylacetate-CoA ligase
MRRFNASFDSSAEALVVTGPGWSASSRQQIVDGVRARLGPDIRFEVKLAEKIPAEPSGKHRYVVSHVRLPVGLAGDRVSVPLHDAH